MATISENLQTIKNSTDAIKQAIIDKGGEISGDITTWASAISGISGGGSSSDEVITFVGTLAWNMMNCTITGYLSSRPEGMQAASLVMVFRNSTGVVMNYANIFNKDIKNISITCNYKEPEPSMGDEIPGLFIAYISGYETKIVPVKFIQQTPIKFYVNDIEYDALYPMTWEQFINSETYNPTLTDTTGYEYKMFFIKDGIVYSWIMYDGECDIETEIYTESYLLEKSTDIIKENTHYIAN